MDIASNTRKKIGKDRACSSGDILADRHTHRQTYSSQYFANAPAGEVINYYYYYTVFIERAAE